MPRYPNPNVFATGFAQQDIHNTDVVPPPSYTDPIGSIHKTVSAAAAAASKEGLDALAEAMPTEGLKAMVGDLGKVTEQLVGSSEHIHTYTQQLMTMLVGRFDFMDQLWCGYAHGLERATGDRPELRLAMLLAFLLSMTLWLWLTYRWVVRPYSSLSVVVDNSSIKKKKDM